MAKGFSMKLYPGAMKKVNKAMQQAVEATASKMLSEKVRQKEIPFDEGTLQNVASYVDQSKVRMGQVAIVHDTPYAARLYYNPQYNFTTTFNPNARGEWWEDYLTGANKERPSKLFAHYVKKFGGDVIT